MKDRKHVLLINPQIAKKRHARFPLAVLNLATGPIAANTTKDLTAPLKTTLRAYELPDWQFLRATVDFPAQH